MSSSDDKASAKARDEQKSVSVLDYLYCDTPRIASYLAQFDDAGHLLKITESESASKGTRRGFRVGGGATVMGTGGHLNLERTPGEEGSEATERVYDPLWANARAIMDYLAEGNMIERDLLKAHLGQFVLVSGALEIRDLKLIQKAIAVIKGHQPEQPKLSDHRNRSKGWQERQQAEQAAQEVSRANMAGLDFIAMLPHAVHAVLNMDGSSAWCSLKPESLIGSSDDILLKHGASIPGEWYILGILDALPDAKAPKEPIEQYAAAKASIDSIGGDNAMLTFVTKGFGAFVDGIAPFARMLLGRQSGSYGMTPLLIFRKVFG